MTIHSSNYIDSNSSFASSIEDKIAKIRFLNKKIITNNPIKKIALKMISLFNEMFIFNVKEFLLPNTAAQFCAEHLSNGSLGGNHNFISFSVLVNAIKNEKSVNFIKLKKSLDYARKINLWLNPFTYFFIRYKVKRDLRHLKAGESIALPCGYTNFKDAHTTSLHVQRKSDGKFLVQHHNEGEDRGHYKKVLRDGRIKYQSVMEIDDVTEENLCGSKFINQILAIQLLWPTHSIDKLYKEVIPLLKGRVKPPSEDKRLWSRAQLGGSCPIRAIISFARSNLSREEYTLLKRDLKLQHLSKLYDRIKCGWHDNQKNRMIALEIAKKIEHDYQKHHIPLPDELKEAKKCLEQLQTRPSLQTVYKQIKKMASKAIFDPASQQFTANSKEEYVRMAYCCFANRYYDEARTYLAKAQSLHLGKMNSMKREKWIDLWTLFVDFNEKHQETSLEELHFLASVHDEAIKFFNIINPQHLSNSKKKKFKKIEKFLESVRYAFRQAHVEAYYPFVAQPR